MQITETRGKKSREWKGQAEGSREEERKVSLNFNTILAIAITINENEAMRKIIAKEEKPEMK